MAPERRAVRAAGRQRPPWRQAPAPGRRGPGLSDDKIHQFPANRRATGYEHMTNDEFVTAVFGAETLAMMRSGKPMDGVWLKVVDKSRNEDVRRELKRRCGAELV